MKKFAAVLLLSGVSAVPAFAADQGGFVNFDLGSVSYTNASSQFSPYPAFGNPGATTIGGGYRFNQNLAVEVDYSMIGDSTITTSVAVPVATITEKLKSSSLQVAAVGTLPIGDKFNVFGKLGLANTKVDYTASVTNATFLPSVAQSASASKTNLMFSLGGQFNFNPHWGIRLQYVNLGKVQLPGQFFGGFTAPNIGVAITSIGGVYSF